MTNDAREAFETLTDRLIDCLTDWVEGGDDHSSPKCLQRKCTIIKSLFV